ncbi:MAG: rod shape-determining protein MreD [Candidatus Margulisbacteria bacterium]|nr:rod shape-determining protein MreD [Candidatus Margulisiibacteriota bacterium]
MRSTKIGLYLLAVIILQTTIFSRLNFFGVVPDLVLVSVVIFTVLEDQPRAILFSAAGGFIQDILSCGGYFNTIVKVTICFLAGLIKESFVGDEYSLAAGLVALFTPLLFIIEGAVLVYFFGRQVYLPYLLSRLVVVTIYNLVLVPVLFPIIKGLLDE